MQQDRMVDLPRPEHRGTMTVEEAMRARRSQREYVRAPLTLEDIGQLLWAAQGVTHGDGLRTAPSAGALYPLEIYIAVGSARDLDDGVYHYEPRTHRLRQVGTEDLRSELAGAAVDQRWMRDAAAIIVITGVVERTARRYGQRAARYVHMEVGHAAQNVYLQATALDLGTVMVGAFYDNDVAEMLQLPAGERPFALMPVGRIP